MVHEAAAFVTVLGCYTGFRQCYSNIVLCTLGPCASAVQSVASIGLAPCYACVLQALRHQITELMHENAELKVAT